MHTVPYLIIHSLICWPSDIPVGKHPNDNNIESSHQEVRHCGEALEADITTCRPVTPGWSLKNFSSYVYIYQSRL